MRPATGPTCIKTAKKLKPERRDRDSIINLQPISVNFFRAQAAKAWQKPRYVRRTLPVRPTKPHQQPVKSVFVRYLAEKTALKVREKVSLSRLFLQEFRNLFDYSGFNGQVIIQLITTAVWHSNVQLRPVPSSKFRCNDHDSQQN
jgi:hypothetical protein